MAKNQPGAGPARYAAGDGAGERVGGIGLFDAASGKKPPHHRLNLFFLRMSDTDHGFLDVVRCVFRDLEPRLRSCQ